LHDFLVVILKFGLRNPHSLTNATVERILTVQKVGEYPAG
jgi:hypothetical protein